jgi:hypothetical protein
MMKDEGGRMNVWLFNPDDYFSSFILPPSSLLLISPINEEDKTK